MFGQIVVSTLKLETVKDGLGTRLGCACVPKQNMKQIMSIYFFKIKNKRVASYNQLPFLINV